MEKKNVHNGTVEGSVFDFEKVLVGKNTYEKINVYCESAGNARLKIANYCSNVLEVEFILGEEDSVHTVSTFLFKNRFM